VSTSARQAVLIDGFSGEDLRRGDRLAPQVVSTASRREQPTAIPHCKTDNGYGPNKSEESAPGTFACHLSAVNGRWREQDALEGFRYRRMWEAVEPKGDYARLL
jgi:hypothetical protein